MCKLLFPIEKPSTSYHRKVTARRYRSRCNNVLIGPIHFLSILIGFPQLRQLDQPFKGTKALNLLPFY